MRIAPWLLAVTLTLAACSDPSGPASAPTEEPSTDESATHPTIRPSPVPTTSPLSPARQRALDERLIRAAWDNDVARARRLIRRGADVNWRDDTVQNAFLIAASEGYDELLELTLRSGARVRLHDSFDGTAIIRAAERGHWSIVGRLLRTPLRAQLDHVNNLGWTALHEAIVLGEATADDVTTVRVLVAGGADVGIPSGRHGMTPLEHARALRQAPVVRTLERAEGRAPSDPDRALLIAARRGDPDGAALAVRAGADLDTTGPDGRSALEVARGRGHHDVGRVLSAMGG